MARDEWPVSAADIVRFGEQVITFRNARLRALLVSAVLEAMSARPESANGRLVFVTESGERGRDVYDVVAAVTLTEVEGALDAILPLPSQPDNYIFVTTEPVEPEVSVLVETLYDETWIEFAILDCIGFLRHFLHLFHRHRIVFLDAYQDLVLAQPDSAVSHELKKIFLDLRANATQEPESGA
jgi:hypothetical protein